jgi:AhpC/TSA family
MKNAQWGLLGVLLGAAALLLQADPASAVEVGQKAPDFTLTAPGNKPVRLADLLGNGPVVIYTFVDAFGAA